jgi:hypothetical protein
VYFENFVILPIGDEFNTFGVQLFNDKKYFVELSIWSDTTRLIKFIEIGTKNI